MTRMLLFTLVSGALAAPVIETLPYGHIDWTHGLLVVEAVGVSNTGAWRDVRAVEQNAFALLEPRVEDHARRVRISADTLAGDLMGASSGVGEGLQDGLADWRVAETRYYSSGRVEIRAELSLQGWLRPALVGQATATTALEPVEAKHTGVVVDARGLSVSLSVGPRLLGPDFEELYSLRFLTEETASLRSPVLWVSSPGDPEAIRRAGLEPMFLQATAVRDGTDLVVARDDAARLRALSQGSPLLRGAKVVVVVDP